MTRLAIGLVTVFVASLFATGGQAAREQGRELRVAYITPVVTAPSSRDLWGQGLLGFHHAVKDLGIRGQVFQPDPNNWGKTFTSVVRQKFDLIFPGVPTTDRDYALLLRLMDKFAASKFVVAGPYKYLPSKPPNVQGTEFKNQEAGYLAGYLAGLMEKRKPGKDVIGAVGGSKVEPVDQFIAGYQAGARKADPHISILNGYSGSFADPAKCRSTALRQIGKGAGVVFNVAGECGVGTLQAAKEKGVWAIGVDVDQSFYGPHVLTSAIQRGDVWVYETVRALIRGKLRTGRTNVWNLRDGGVGLGEISPRVPPSVTRQVAQIRAQIIAGKIDVPDALK